MPIMNGISLPILNFFCVEHITTVMKVIKPQSKATRLYDAFTAVPTLALTMSPIALPARLRPIIATVGPMITGGISFDTQAVPAK